MSSKASKAIAWLRENAFFVCECDGCSEEVSYHAEMLRERANAELVCESCWGYISDDELLDNERDSDGYPVMHSELPPFDPFKDIELALAGWGSFEERMTAIAQQQREKRDGAC